MNRAIRVLHLEDDPDYCDFVQTLLATEGIDAQFLVATGQSDYEAFLEKEQLDLILADYLLPGYDGLKALESARAKCPKVPFLLVSGTIGEQAAIQSLKAGATDYVLKAWPDRLIPAIRRALKESQESKERQRIETEFLRRERYYRTLTENALDVLTTMDAEGGLLYVSPSVERILGYESKALLGHSAFELVHPEDRTLALARFKDSLGNPDLLVRMDLRVLHQNGTWRYLEAMGQNRLAEPDMSAVVVTLRDVTDRKQAEASLQESEQRFRDLFENSPDAIFVEDLNGTVLDVNPAACRLHGLPREQLLGMNISLLVPPQQVEVARQEFKALVEGASKQIEGASLTAQGHSVPVEVRASRIDYAGRPAVLLHVRDVTERKQAEAALRSSEMLFHSVWENSVDGMRLTDDEGRIVAVNDAYCSLVGLERGELEGKLLTIVYAEAEQPEETLRQYREEFGRRMVRQRDEQKLTLRNGTVVTFEQTSSFVELRGKPPLMLSLFRDIGARKRLEDQLRQSQKMEAIGQLAGGVAHDFNNILTVIHGHACLLAGGNLNPNAAKSAQQISQAAERAASLTRQMLTFSRRQMMQPRLLDLNEVVANMTNMLGRILGEDIALQLKYSPQPALVNADAGMLEQVLLNCAVNSRDAMPQGGVLKLRISVREFSASELPTDAETKAGRFVCLSVTDTGCGIPAENLRRIFEPFFTTKEVGKGTGLGLATVYGIVRQHHGWIDVDSTVGKGTTFLVYFPASEEVLASPEPQVPEAVVRGGDETILVVEDEGPVRELVCQVLERHGYHIYQAQSGAEALGLWTEKGSQIDLLLTDLVMPDRISGRELAQRLWLERPGLKVIFTSGYSADVVGPDFVLKSGLNFLQKPFQPQTLAVAVRQCLDYVN